jgi:cardiolipin synthase
MLDFSARKIFTLANFISASRIVAVPFIGWLLFIDSVPARLAAGALLLYAILSDFLDGLAARALNQVSDLGKIIDPLADKLFVILLAIELIFLRDFPVWLALVIIAKDALIIVASILVAGKKKVVMQSNIIGKYAFGFQAGLVVCYFLDFPFGELFFTVGSLILIAASLVSYGKALQFVMRSEEEEVVVPTPPQAVPNWARRVFVALLLVLVLAHMYYWLNENSAINIRPELPRQLRGEPILPLARLYAPVFVFSSNDGTRPLAVADYLGSASLRQGFRYFWGPLDRHLKSAPLRPGDLLQADSHEAYLAIGGGTREHLDSSAQAEIYVHHAVAREGNTDWVVIEYWALFAHETSPAARDGDWQMAAVYLLSDGTPKYLVLTQGWYAMVVPWGEAELRGGRPAVYVAPGSHSFYPSAGSHSVYLDEEKVFSFGSEAAFDGEEFGSQREYELRLVSVEDPWVSWAGRWGGPLPGGDRGPMYWNPKKPERAPWSHPMEFLRFYER